MTVNLELKADVEAGLLALAQARGISLEAYVEELLQITAAKAPKPRRAGRKSLVEVFAPLRGIEVSFSRNPSNGRPVDL